MSNYFIIILSGKIRAKYRQQYTQGTSGWKDKHKESAITKKTAQLDLSANREKTTKTEP